MGCNYYVKFDTCPTCNRAKEDQHIGKSSMGWKFTFDGFKQSYKEWRIYLGHFEDRIVDEYERQVSFGHLIALIEQKQSDHSSQADHDGHIDDEGYVIGSCDFS